MPIRWSPEEELKFIKAIKNGKTFEELSPIHNRSVNALFLHLKKIIHRNITKGISQNKISLMLNIPVSDVNRYYFAYEDFLKAHEQKIVKNTVPPQADTKNFNIAQNDVIENKILKRENKLLKQLLSDIKIRTYIYNMYKNKTLCERSRKIIQVLIKSGLIYTI